MNRNFIPTDDANGVLIIYTGGTLGSITKNDDPLSPLIPGSLKDIFKYISSKYYDASDQKIFIDEEWVKLGFHSFDPPIDSSNVTPEDWRAISKTIRDNYSKYEGFVVIHGTDTMAYTASALSFMLMNLNKPVIITGSQKPIASTRSDAVQNLITSIEIAAASSLNKFVVPEVTVFFRDELLRGCRTSKYSASNYSGFKSPNLLNLGFADEYITYNESFISKGSQQSLRIDNQFESNIIILSITPGMDLDLLEEIMTSEKIKGIIIKTYGTGNAPTSQKFLDIIEKSINNGKVIINITQCLSGEVELGLYDVSAGLLSRGIVTGMDMTDEAAYTKLGVLLAREKNESGEINSNKVADLMQLNLKGEQRQSVFRVHFNNNSKISLEDEPTIIYQKGEKMVESIDRKYNYLSIDKAFLRIMRISIKDANRGLIKLKVFINDDSASEDTNTDSPNYIGSKEIEWRNDNGEQSIFFNITEQAKKFIDNSQKVRITLINLSGRELIIEKMDVAIFNNDN